MGKIFAPQVSGGIAILIESGTPVPPHVIIESGAPYYVILTEVHEVDGVERSRAYQKWCGSKRMVPQVNYARYIRLRLRLRSV